MTGGLPLAAQHLPPRGQGAQQAVARQLPHSLTDLGGDSSVG
jgi:hypothetical protein